MPPNARQKGEASSSQPNLILATTPNFLPQKPTPYKNGPNQVRAVKNNIADAESCYISERRNTSQAPLSERISTQINPGKPQERI